VKAKEVLEITKISREHLSRLVKKGVIKAQRLENNHLNYDKESVFKYIGKETDKLNIIYGRVSTSRQKKDLLNQVENLERFCFANGYKVHKTYQDVASGINFEKRKEFFELLDLVIDGQVSRVFITYKDRLSRVGFGLFKHLFLKFGTEIVVINESDNAKLDSEEIRDFLSSFNISKQKQNKIKSVLSEEEPKN
jgi:putative resolvase